MVKSLVLVYTCSCSSSHHKLELLFVFILLIVNNDDLNEFNKFLHRMKRSKFFVSSQKLAILIVKRFFNGSHCCHLIF